MTRDEAVARIQRGLGFITNQEDVIISVLKEAQDDLEQGKTLPRLLLHEFQALNLLAGSSSVTLPERFIRPDDDNKLHYIVAGESKPRYIEWVTDFNLNYQLYYSTTPAAPRVAYLAKTAILFITVADSNYTIGWSYYAGAAPLDSNVENEWLADKAGKMWLIGEAGYRVAKDKRDATATDLFDAMRTQGRAACFGEELARHDSMGPIYMGSQL